MSILDWRDWVHDLFEEERREKEAAELRQAKFDRMRRVSPKGTYVPAKLAKAKRRVPAGEF